MRIVPASLRVWRLRCGLDQGQLAEELGVIQQTVSHWETGRHPITARVVRQVMALAKAWQVDPPRTRKEAKNV